MEIEEREREGEGERDGDRERQGYIDGYRGEGERDGERWRYREGGSNISYGHSLIVCSASFLRTSLFALNCLI